MRTLNYIDVDLFEGSPAILVDTFSLQAHPDALDWLRARGIFCLVSTIHSIVNGRKDAIGVSFRFSDRNNALMFKLVWG